MIFITGCVFPLRDLLRAQSEAIDEIVSGKVVYVARQHAGDELGSAADPFISIQTAIDFSSDLISDGRAGTLEIHIAEDMYDLSRPVRLAPGVSLCGGYSYPDWVYDPISQNTVLHGNDDIIISFEPACDNDTIVQDLVLQSGPLDEVTGIECNGASPVIRNNTIDLRAAWKTSAGILLISSNAVIDSNRILFGAVSDNSWGIAAIDSGADIRNNILAGAGGAGPSIAFHSTQGSDLDVLNNTIYLAGSGGDTAVFISSSMVRLENNILSAASDCRGIYMNNTGAIISSLHNNEFFGSADPLIRLSDGTTSTLVSEMEIYIGAAASDNDSGTDPQYVDPDVGDFHITNTSLPSGRDLSGEFQHDADKSIRTIPWSIGAYELD